MKRLLALLAFFAFLPLACTHADGVEARPDDLAAFGASEVYGARPLPPLPEMPAAELAGSISFFAVGDTGYGGRLLGGVARSMERSARERPADLALLLGDNFYTRGVETTDDERWKTIFEEPFGAPALAVPFYAVLGNHDHRGSAAAQIEYSSRSEKWKMPARWYSFAREGASGVTAQFFALDTDAIEESWPDAKEQIAWLANELSLSKARWKVVFAHHPALSHGRHGGTKEVVRDVVPLFERFGVDLYVTGHDHDLQLLDSRKGWIQVVSGAGSSTRDVRWGDDTLYADAAPGYARIDLGPNAMWIEFATAAEGPQFRWRVAKD